MIHTLISVLFSLYQTPEEDEEEDFKVLPSDNLLAIGKAEEDYSSVEIHGIYNNHSPVTSIDMCRHITCIECGVCFPNAYCKHHMSKYIESSELYQRYVSLIISNISATN